MISTQGMLIYKYPAVRQQSHQRHFLQ